MNCSEVEFYQSVMKSALSGRYLELRLQVTNIVSIDMVEVMWVLQQ